MSDAISSYIQEVYRAADQNRRDLTVSWENCRRYFAGNLYPDTEKPLSDDTWKVKEGLGWRSKTFPGGTHAKVLSACAVVLDIMLAGGQIPFMLKPSPWQEHTFKKMPPPDAKQTEADINSMSALIDQQFSDCQAERTFEKNVLSMALYGLTYSKISVHKVKRTGFKSLEPEIEGISDWSRMGAQYKQWVQWANEFLAPSLQYIPVWDIFRDWETDDMRECSFVIHRQIVDNWWIRQKKGRPFYLNDNIETAIKSAKSSGTRQDPTVKNNEDVSNMAPVLRNYLTYRTNNRQILEYWGRIPRDIVEQFEADISVGDTKTTNQFNAFNVSAESFGDEIEVMAQSVEGEQTIRYTRTEPGMRPFFQSKWEDNGDEWIARGVAHNCAEMHRVIRGTFRGAEDNIKLANNVILAVKERFIKNMPAELTPGYKLLLSDDCDDARKAVQPVVIPDVSAGLIALYQIAKNQLDDDSLVPKIAQGLTEKNRQTAREAAAKQAQSMKYIGMAIRNADQTIEDVVMEFYKYNMSDPQVTEGKGNYIVQALGFSSFQNKTERLQHLQQALMMALQSPQLGQETKIAYLWEEILKALDLDPDQVLKSDLEKQQEAQAQAQSPQTQIAMQGAVAAVDKDKAKAIKDKASAVAQLAKAKGQTVKNEKEIMEPPAQPELSLGSTQNDTGGVQAGGR